MKKLILFSCLIALSFGVVAQTNPVKVFGLGNSFTEDAMLQELMPICKSAGFQATLAYPYKGGTTYAEHVQRYKDSTVIYNYKKWEWGASTMATTGTATYTLNDALAEDTWDVVVFQQCAQKQYYTYSMQTQELQELLDTVTAAVPSLTRKGYYMYWPDQVGGNNLLPAGQQATWDTIKTTCQKIMQNYGFDFLIPVGTAIQNARSSYLGDNLNRDKHHLSYTHGRYIASLTWYEVLSGQSCVGISYHPAEITDWAARVCQEAVHQAVLNPYELYDMSQDYGEDKGDAGIIVFDMVQTDNQTLAQSTGYVSGGYTMTAKTTAGTTISTNGQNIAPYTTDNTNYIKVANLPNVKTTMQWTSRDASTDARTWYIYYLLLDAGTDISSLDLSALALPYDTITKASGACQIRSLKSVELDLTTKDTLQDLYFFQTNANSNALTFRTLYLTIDAPKPKDTNANLSLLGVSDLNMGIADTVYAYANVENSSFPVHVVLASKTATARVYQDGSEVEVSNEPEIYLLSTPAIGDTTRLTIYTTAEDSTSTKTYSVVVTGANFIVSDWDLMLLGDTALQNSILAGNPYEKGGLKLVARQALSDLFNFGDSSKPGLYIRNAKAAYGSCGLLLQLPAGTKGHLQLQIRPGATEKNYIYYAYAQDSGTVAPDQLYNKTEESVCLGNVLNGLKSLNYLTDGAWLDYSEKTVPQDVYIYHTAGGMRYQRLIFTRTDTTAPTALQPAVADTGTGSRKILRDGQLLILKDGIYYNILGTIVK